jgi:hypothetical protein
MEKSTRAYQIGKEAGTSEINKVHLMYQNNTALNYLQGLIDTLSGEYSRRLAEKKAKTKVS